MFTEQLVDTQVMDEELCWQAVQSRNPQHDGKFVYGVITTGVYCRPSCRGRQALRKNVRFYPNAAEAERDGLRACLRCRPLQDADDSVVARKINDICAFLRENCDSGIPLTLETLGRRVGLSSFHLQRMFKAVVGVTPRQYVEACRLDTLKRQLRAEDNTITDAIYNAGFGSSSRVYERVDKRLGMTPAQYRNGAEHLHISYASSETLLGLMMVGATDRGICFVQFGQSDDELLDRLRTEYPAASLQPMHSPHPEQFRLWIEALSHHLSGQTVSLTLPLHLQATAFQHKVWHYLQSIPYGEVQSYTQVAEGIGQPGAARAVAGACAANRVAIVIPCHRVIRGTGALSGYRWGIERKRALLDQERVGKTANSG